MAVASKPRYPSGESSTIGSQLTLSPFVQLICREIVTHRQLRHQNIIPLLGVFRETDEDSPMMILPFVENGSAVDYLNRAAPDDIYELTWKIVS
jgi:serine/threonine protein kinase